MGLFDYDPYSQFSLDPQGQQFGRMTNAVSPYWEPEPPMSDVLSSVAPPSMTARDAPGVASGLASALSQPPALPEGLPAEPGGNLRDHLSGSLTQPNERFIQSTGFTSIANMDQGKVKESSLDPLDVMMLPFRAIGLVDRSLKTALGLKTQGDAARSAAEYLKYGQDNQWQGFDKISPGAAAGMNQQLGGGTPNPLDFLTGARQDQERQVIDAAHQARARRAEYEQQAQLGTAQANQSYAETRNAWEPTNQAEGYRSSNNLNLGREFGLEHQDETYNLDRDYKRRNMQHLDWLETQPRGGSLGLDPLTKDIEAEVNREFDNETKQYGVESGGLTPAKLLTEKRLRMGAAKGAMGAGSGLLGAIGDWTGASKLLGTDRRTQLVNAGLQPGIDFVDAEPYVLIEDTGENALPFLRKKYNLPETPSIEGTRQRVYEKYGKRTSTSQAIAPPGTDSGATPEERLQARGMFKKEHGHDPTEAELDAYLLEEVR